MDCKSLGILRLGESMIAFLRVLRVLRGFELRFLE